MYDTQTRVIRRIGQLIRSGELGIKKGKPTMKVRPFYSKTKSRLLDIMTRTMNFGRGQVQNEIERQAE